MCIKQDCKFYDYEAIETVIGVDFYGGPVYDIIDEQEICYKLDSEPKCDGCNFYEKRIIEVTNISELPF